MASMEDQVLELLKNTQDSSAQTRNNAEQRLSQLRSEPTFAPALVNIGVHKDIPVSDRVAALINLKNFVNASWSSSLEDFSGHVLIADDAKEVVRTSLLNIVYDGGDDSKVTSATAAVVSKIAKADFPEEWPSLIDSLLSHLPQSPDAQTQGILVVLSELITDGLDEEQFYRYATALVGALHTIAIDNGKKTMIRAHAINIFRSCFDFVENLKEKDEGGIKTFSQNVCDTWAPFFLQVLQEPMPTYPSAEEEENSSSSEVAMHWQGVVALKIQVVLTLARIQGIFPDLMAAQEFFEACWNAIQEHGVPYYSSYVDGDRQGALINQYQLPYTIDLLVIEEIDYLQILLEAPLVQQHLNGMKEADSASGGSTVSQWITSVLRTLVQFSCITREAEEMWDVDFNVFLSEETFAEANNSPRSVCASFVWKICTWFPKETLESLLGFVKTTLHEDASHWRLKEASLFTLQQVGEEYVNESRGTDPNLARLCVELIHPTLNDPQQYLRARGHITMAAALQAWTETLGSDYAMVMSYANASLNAMENDQSDIVKTACIRIMRDYLTTLPASEATQLQSKVVDAIAKFMETQQIDDLDENVNLMDIVLQTLRDTVIANPATCLDHKALDVMITLVKHGAARDYNGTVLIDEAFESAAHEMARQGPAAYTRLCERILPSVMAAFDIEDPNTAETTSLSDVCASILKILAETAAEPLPHGFVEAAMPRLCRLIFAQDVDFYLCQNATLTIKHMLMNDKDQVFNWTDPATGKNGLEMIFLVIGHLLGPQVEDISAGEVGELAVSVVEKVDHSTLGNSMHELLQIITNRLSTAEHFTLIQTLSMVFARLSLFNAKEIIDFLSDMHVGDKTGLEVVMKKWLENATLFVGFEAIRQNVSALVAIYRLNDPRLAAINVNGDMIPDTSSRIKTRSMAKSQPIQYTIVSAPLKIVKILVAELVPYGDPSSAFPPNTPLKSPAIGSLHRRDGSEDEWEDEEDELAGAFGNRADDETQEFLVQFFKGEGADPRFQELFSALTEEEKKRTMDAVHQRDLATGAS